MIPHTEEQERKAINTVERIIEICKEKKIPVSKLEKDLGYGNGFLNPKKVTDIKSARLFEILDYLEISVEEFYKIGSERTQKTSTALMALKKADPEFFNYIMFEREDHDVVKLSNASDLQLELIDMILKMSDDKVSAILALAKSFSMN